MRWRLGLILIFTALGVLLSQWPASWQAFLEVVYGETFYPIIQSLLNALPSPKRFPLADLLWLAIPALFVVRIVLLVRKNLIRRTLSIALEAGLWLSAGYLLIILMWGLNYQRPTLYSDLKYQGFTTQLKNGHWEFALEETQKVIDALPSDFDFCQASGVVYSSERSGAFAHSAMALANLTPAPPRSVKASKWSWFYTRIALGGVYIPFTGDPTYNGNMYTLSKPFVMTHEYGHWAGAATEYDADILAYWSLWLSPDPIWQYSAWLQWWTGIAEPKDVKAKFPTELQETISCLIEHNQAQPRWNIRKWFWRIYDTNLKSQGVSEGLKSYSMGEAMALSSYQDWLYQKANRTLR